ncbi:MAG: DUF3379 family protein [Betaproteobacteria bacterium]|nr:DUF3379 family protein [Betaproteobacteria bacterium]
MNCLELRRAVMVDPRRLDTEALAHAERCDVCRGFLADALELEAGLDAALSVSVPHGLKERAMGRARDDPRLSRRYALAAGLMLAIGAGTTILWRQNDPLALAGIDFVVFEESQAILDAKPSDPDDLARVAVQMGINLPWQLGELRYIGTCPFAGTMAHHVVLKTAYGKATLLLLPGRTQLSRAAAVARGLEAVVAPATGGSVAIIADSSRSLARIEESLQNG